MKKRLFLLSSLAIIIASLTILGCQNKEFWKGDENKTQVNLPDVTVENGMLKFESAEDYFKTRSAVSGMTNDELEAWESSIGFESVRKKQIDVYEKLNTLTDEDEQELRNIVAKNSKYFEIILNEDGEEELIAKNEEGKFASLLNSDFMYAVENTATKVLKNHIISTDINNVQAIKNISSVDEIADKASVNIKKRTITELSKRYTSCANPAQIHVTKDERWCRNDRRAYLKVEMITVVDNDWLHTNVIVKAYGKRKVSCVWVAYSTGLEWKGVNFKITHPVEPDNVYPNQHISSGTFYYDFADKYGNGYSITKERIISEFRIGSGNSTFTHAYFNYMYGNVSSGGVGNRWGTLDCGSKY